MSLDIKPETVDTELAATAQGLAGSPVRVDPTGTTAQPITDNAGSLTVDGTVTANLAAGTNNIGDVDVLTVPAPLSTTGGGTEATALRVTVATDSTGVLSVDDNGASITVDDASLDNATLVDNAGFTDGTTRVLMAGYILDETGGTALTENDAGASRMDSKRATVSVIEDETTRGRRASVTAANALKVDASSVAVPVTDNAGSLTVDQATATNLKAEVVGASSDNSANATTKLPVIAARANASVPAWTEGNQAPLSVDLSGRQRTDVSTWIGSTAPTVGSKTSANSVPVVIASDQGNVAVSQATASSLNAEVQGDAAQDAAVSGNPVLIGGRASTAVPTAMSADGDAVDLWANRQGASVVTMAPHVGIFGSQPWNLTSKTAQYTTTQTSAILVNGGASERLVVTYIQIGVGGTTAGTLQVYFGTGAYARGTNLAIFDHEFAPSATLKPGFVANGPWISVTNGDDILVTTSAAINPLTITVWYYVVV